MANVLVKFWLLCFLLLFVSHTSSGDDSLHLIGWFCYRGANNTASTRFSLNLGRLFRRKLYDEGRNSIYYNTTDGENPDKVYGLYLCRGDVTTQICQSCIEAAIDSLDKECRGTLNGITWYDECLVRYSNRSFLHTFETSPAKTVSNIQELTVSDPVAFREALNQSFTQLIANAISSELKYATKAVNVSNATLYTLGQCIPDLSEEACRDCLLRAAQLVESDKRGSRYLCPSCSARFELYPFFRNPNGRSKRKKNWIWIPISVSVVGAVSLLGCFFWCMRGRNNRNKEEKANSQEVRLIHLNGRRHEKDHSFDALQEVKQVESQDFPLFPFNLTLEATENFADENKLGEGGFGPVYKGVLANGNEIAVKRLSNTSGQGLREFKNEVNLIARLQHKNLVRLLGCCVEQNELLLIYDYMPNKSLDVHLFDPAKSIQLDWKTRVNIINGIARGLLYLHEDSRLRIIHRDLKASNVLLDYEMNPKISDFGMARIFGGNQNEANTNRVVGTYGYMSPEYAMEGLFSVKSDVFSFGVILLEVISGKKNSGFYQTEHGLSLLNYAWKLWCEERAQELLDPVLKMSCAGDEMLKYIHIGLLCVQEDPSDRPSMSSVVVMLVSDNIKLPQPTEPAFSVGRATKPGLSSSNFEVCSNEVTISNLNPR